MNSTEEELPEGPEQGETGPSDTKSEELLQGQHLSKSELVDAMDAARINDTEADSNSPNRGIYDAADRYVLTRLQSDSEIVDPSTGEVDTETLMAPTAEILEAQTKAATEEAKSAMDDPAEAKTDPWKRLC